MTLAVLGLGRMGMQIARRLHNKRFNIVAWNRNPAKRAQFKKFGGKVADSIPKLVAGLKRPRTIWIMVPAAETDKFIQELSLSLSKGDVVIDGSNSFYQDSVRRAKKLAVRKIHYLDVGVSGGVWGEKNGFSLMVGGEKNTFKKVEPIFKALAASSPQPSPAGTGRKGEGSYGLVGKNGAGHFVKMVHNGIEYGTMEALAEGFSVLDKSPFKLNLGQIAQIWQKGAVVRSWLLDLCADIFKKEDLSKVIGLVAATGEGLWTVKTAQKLGVDVRVIKAALEARRESQTPINQKLFRNQLLTLMRNRFGGHEVLKKRT